MTLSVLKCVGDSHLKLLWQGGLAFSQIKLEIIIKNLFHYTGKIKFKAISLSRSMPEVCETNEQEVGIMREPRDSLGTMIKPWGKQNREGIKENDKNLARN